MFWHVVQKLPFTTQPIVAWKLSHVFHKVIRDGHPMVSYQELFWFWLVDL